MKIIYIYVYSIFLNLLEIFFPKKTSDLKFKELVFFKVEINDPSNAIILGQTQDYCWDDRCTFPSVKGL